MGRPRRRELSQVDLAQREEIWIRQPEETAKSYEAFSIYRDLGHERSFAEAYRQYSGRAEAGLQPPGYFTDWARDYLWKDRALAYDQSKDETIRAAVDKAYRETFEKIAQASGLAVSVIIGIAAGRRSRPSISESQESVREDTQLWAARDLLDRLGVKAPKRVEVSDSDDESLTSWAALLQKAQEFEEPDEEET